MNFETTLYDILGVSSTATPEEIKKAFRKKSRLLHPDASGQDTTDMFQMVQKAYGVLSDEESRAEYDEHLENKNNPPAPEPEYEEPSWGEEEVWEDPVEEEEVWEEVVEDDSHDNEPYNYQDNPAAEDHINVENTDGFFAPERHIDMQRMSWYNRIPFTEEKLVPGLTTKTHTIIFWIAFGILALSASLPLLMLSAGAMDKSSAITLSSILAVLILPMLGQIIPFPWKMRYSKPSRIASIISLVASGLILLFLGWMMMASATSSLLESELLTMFSSIVFAAVVSAATIGGYISGRHIKINREGDAYTVSLRTAENNIYGLPGQLEDAIAKFGVDNVEAGIEGEKRTASILEQVATTIPSARVFHGLGFPGSQTADVDHGILVGNRLVLIDSKMWKENHYAWDQTGNITEIMPNGFRRQRITHFPAAVEKYNNMLPKVEVRGWILVHPRNGRDNKLSFDNRYARNTEIGNAEDAINEIGDWLLEGKKSQIVNRKTIRTLFNNMK